MEHWTSCKNKFDLSPDKFGELRSSNDLLTNPDAFRQRMAEDGYLLLRRFLDKNKVRAARNELLVKMERNGSVDDDYLKREGVDPSLKSEVNTKSFREGDAVRTLACQPGHHKSDRTTRPGSFSWARISTRLFT